MKKKIAGIVLIGCMIFSSCTVNYINTNTLMTNYENKINKTSLLGRVLFKTDKKKKGYLRKCQSIS